MGVAVIGAGSFLPWVTGRGASLSAWDLTLRFLFGLEDDVGGPKLGPVLLIVVLEPDEIKIRASEVSHPVTGSIAADGHFDIRTTVQDRFMDEPDTVELELSGQFVKFDQDVLLRGGVLSINYAGRPGQVSFTGQRQR